MRLAGGGGCDRRRFFHRRAGRPHRTHRRRFAGSGQWPFSGRARLGHRSWRRSVRPRCAGRTLDRLCVGRFPGHPHGGLARARRFRPRLRAGLLRRRGLLPARLEERATRRVRTLRAAGAPGVGQRHGGQCHRVDGAQSRTVSLAPCAVAGAPEGAARAAAGWRYVELAGGPLAAPAPRAVRGKRSPAHGQGRGPAAHTPDVAGLARLAGHHVPPLVQGGRLARRLYIAAADRRGGTRARSGRFGALPGAAPGRVRRAHGQPPAEPRRVTPLAIAPPGVVRGHAAGLRRGGTVRAPGNRDGRRARAPAAAGASARAAADRNRTG